MRMFRESALEFKNLRSVVVTGLLVAVSMVIESFTIQLGFAKINFAFLAIAAIGMLYGPTVSFFAGALCDIVGYLVAPDGAFMPVYVLLAAVQGLIYGLIAYRKFPVGNETSAHLSRNMCIRLCIARIVDVVLINLICNTTANLHYGFIQAETVGAAIVARVSKNLLELPFDFILIVAILPAVLKAYQIVFGKKNVAA